MSMLRRATIAHRPVVTDTTIIGLGMNSMVVVVVVIVVKDNSRIQRSRNATMRIGMDYGVSVIEVEERKIVGVHIHLELGSRLFSCICVLCRRKVGTKMAGD